MDTPQIAIVVPCFNEEEVLPKIAEKLLRKIRSLIDEHSINEQSKILFVDDGSTDNTWNLIEKLHAENPQHFAGIKLSGNKGHQNALLCGLLSIKNHVDATISIDADLQDDIDVIDRMVEKYRAGHEIVYGVRSDRKSDSFFKRTTAQIFYRIMRFLGVNIVYNHADFRLMGKNALNALAEYREVNLFLRGIVPLLGFKTDVEYYVRSERIAGTSKYPLGKMVRFAMDGITSFSAKPIRVIMLLGILLFMISVGMIIHSCITYFMGITVSGWASIVCSIWGIGGLTLFSIGLVGEYIGKIYLEVKHRPKFHVEHFLLDKDGVENIEKFNSLIGEVDCALR